MTKTNESAHHEQGLEELNVLEWVLVLLSRQAPTHLRTITACDEITDAASGQKVKRSFLMSAPSALTLPNWQDIDILLALFKLTMQRTGFQERQLQFSLYEILKSLHLSDSSHYCHRMSESLDRWSGVWNKFINAWRRNEKWTSENFHIIDRVKMNRGRDRDPDARQVIYWNDAILESVLAHHTKGLNWELYLSMKPTTKRLFRFLDKRFNQKSRRPSWTYDLVKFCHNKIGLSPNYGVNKCKEKLQPSIHELEQKGFLAPMSDDERFAKQCKGLWLVDFRPTKKLGKKENSPAADLVEQLTMRSVNSHKAAAIAATHTRETVEEKIRYYDTQRRRGKNLQPGFLVASIEQQYLLRADSGELNTDVRRHDNAAQVETATAPMSAADCQTRRLLDSEERIRQEYWNSLSENEKKDIEREAFEHADRLALDGWKRANSTGLKRVATEYRDAILNKCINRRLATYQKAS